MRLSTDSITTDPIEVAAFHHRPADITTFAITNPNHNIDLTERPDIRFIFNDTIEIYANARHFEHTYSIYRKRP